MKKLTKAAIGLSAVGAAYLWYRKNNDAMSAESPVRIHGFVKEGFEAVREAFAENFSKRLEIGAAFCVYHIS